MPQSLDIKKAVLNKNDLVLVISQSGETADTLGAIKEDKKKRSFNDWHC